jgi:8-oxo-(d)GTP phosphatase
VKKTLVLIRHAHRDTSEAAADNGLSPKGRAQAEALPALYKKRLKEEAALLLSSPKRRCLETLAPLAESLGAKVRKDPRLLEGDGGDLEGFLSWWKEEAPARVVACSHGDWIPYFLHLAAGALMPVRKGSWTELSLEGGSVKIAFHQPQPE